MATEASERTGTSDPSDSIDPGDPNRGPGGSRRIWGWFFFDWASQPYNTLLITFVFAPYIRELVGDGARAQEMWGYCTGAAAIVTALLAPPLGASADLRGTRMRWMWVFSAMYVVGAASAWWAAPGMSEQDIVIVLAVFAIGIVGMELGTNFTNAMLPSLGERSEMGRVSGSGFAFGYWGGLIALALVLALLVENSETGRTLTGAAPAFGLDAETRQGTRIVGPFVALWYAVFMIPFFLWVRESSPATSNPPAGLPEARPTSAIGRLLETLRALPRNRSLLAYLGSSMLYRDGLAGLYSFGGIYASGVLGWTIVEIGVFGIIGIVAAAGFSWLGGFADRGFGPRTVIRACVLVLIFVTVSIMLVTPDSLYGIAVGPDSNLPDVAFYVLGAMIGAAGGVLQAASRTMMALQCEPERMTEGFGLYALAGKATSFVAPMSIAIVTGITGSQRLGIAPLVVLFALGLVLLAWVGTDGSGGKNGGDGRTGIRGSGTSERGGLSESTAT